MLTRFVISRQGDEHENIRETVDKTSRPKPFPVYTCTVCGREYRYAKAKENHEKREHPDVILDVSLEEEKKAKKGKTGPDSKPENKLRDDRYNYSTLRMSMGMLLRNFDNAVKEGDGERILRCWKFALLIYRAKNHTKYALAALQLQACIQALLSPRESNCLMWNRTVSNRGGPGCNIPMDIRLEHLNNLTKEILKHLGVNLTENAAKHCSKAVGHVDNLISAVDKELHSERPSGHHKVRGRENDFKQLIHEFHRRGRVFDFDPHTDREYSAFGNFQKSLIEGLILTSLSKWITHHKKELHKLEPL